MHMYSFVAWVTYIAYGIIQISDRCGIMLQRLAARGPAYQANWVRMQHPVHHKLIYCG